jgi:hypothetical protein
MVKRFVVSILAFFYLGLASGVVINLHYCMGELSSVEYGYHGHTKCGACGMEEKDGCCNTELKVIKLQDSHEWTKPGWLPGNNNVTLPFTAMQAFSFSAPLHTQGNSSIYFSPPDYRMNSIYLHTSILRI